MEGIFLKYLKPVKFIVILLSLQFFLPVNLKAATESDVLTKAKENALGKSDYDSEFDVNENGTTDVFDVIRIKRSLFSLSQSIIEIQKDIDSIQATLQSISEMDFDFDSLQERIDNIKKEQIESLNSRFLPYSVGYIHFKVSVNQQIVSNDASDVTCFIKLPKSYTPIGKKTKLLMICHGAGRGITIPNSGDGGTWETNDNYNALVDTFVNAGYAVFDCNGYCDTYSGCNFWGAPRGVEAWRKAYDYVVSQYNVEENLSIYGFSMGGLTALNLVMNGFPNVNAVALGSPVLDTQKAFENGNAAIIQEAYDMGSTWDPIIEKDCNPIQRIVVVDDTEMILQNLPPIKIWFGSTEESETVNKNYAIRFVNAINNGGGSAIYREVEGETHRICYGANANCNKEYLYWINEYNN